MAIAFVGDRQPRSQGLFLGLARGGKKGLLPLRPKEEKRPWERDFKVKNFKYVAGWKPRDTFHLLRLPF